MRRHILVPNLLIVLALTCFLFPSHTSAQESEPVIDPEGFHLLIRLAGARKTYKLGEPIQVEFGCYADDLQRYRAACAAAADDPASHWLVLEVTSLDPGAKIAVDKVETHWIERTLCAYKLENIDFPNYPTYPPVGQASGLRQIHRKCEVP